MISLLVHEVGSATRKLGDLSIGESLYQMVGPLGRASQMDKYGVVICVATGIGAAQILPICRGLKKKGNKVIGIIGAKSKKVLMLESQMRVVCDEIFITTNDGSYERRGLATGLLKELLDKYTVHRVYAIGSVEMMQAAAQMTMEKNIPLRVTLNPYMVNGLGICGSCRVKADGQIYWWETSMRQVEVSRTLVFDAPRRARSFFEALIGDNLDIGRPANVEIIFARRIRRDTPGTFRTAIDRPAIGPDAAASCSTCSTSIRGSSSTSRTAAPCGSRPSSTPRATWAATPACPTSPNCRTRRGPSTGAYWMLNVPARAPSLRVQPLSGSRTRP